MSPTQQKVMQYLPVVFAVFQIFFLTALVVYYIFQTLLRILQQYYITKKFYGDDNSLGRQAQRAGEEAREESKANGESQGLFAQAKRDLQSAKAEPAPKDKPAAKKSNAAPTGPSKRVTAPKGRPTASGKDVPSGKGGKGRPTPSRKEAQAAKNRPTKSARPSGGSSGGKKNSGKKKR